jgi:transcription elongation factor Elf1
MTAPKVPTPLLAEQPLVVLCPHCKCDSLKATAIGPDLRTITAVCTRCGRRSVITVSD